MSHWNYRIMEDGEGKSKYYSLREVFYTDKNEINGYSLEPECPIGESVDELIHNIEMMLKDALKTKDDIITSDIECKGWEEDKECKRWKY